VCVIRLDGLTMTEAEALVAVLWRALEEYQIPSPRLRVFQQIVGEGVDLCIEFRSAQEAELVAPNTRLPQHPNRRRYG
jgi:hypothetical protein